MFYFTTKNLLNLKRKQTQTTQSACCEHRSLFHKQKNTAPLSYDAVVKNQSVGSADSRPLLEPIISRAHPKAADTGPR
jgi:hypothetical protein